MPTIVSVAAVVPRLHRGQDDADVAAGLSSACEAVGTSF